MREAVAELAADAAREEAAEAAELAAELAAEAAELTIMEAEEAAEATAELAADAAEVATEAGTETEIPAALQTPARAGATSVGRLVWIIKKYHRVGERTSSVISRAAGGAAGLERAGDSGLTGGALAGNVGDTAARSGDGSNKTGNL